MMKKWFVVLTAMLVLLSSCSQEEAVPAQETIEEEGLTVYLVNSTNDALVEVDVEVDTSTTASQLESVLQRLYEGNGDDEVQGTIPAKDLVEGYEVRGSGIVLHMSPAFERLDDVTMLICRSSMIKSITAIDGIDFIEFYIDGLPMKDDEGKVYGPFYPAEIITASEIIDEKVIDRSVVLYYPNEDATGLLQVQRDITMKASESIERTLIEALMDAPKDKGVVSPLPDGTLIKNVHTKDGICYVDFGESFRINHYGGSSGEMLTVYGVVNTLTELPDISRVQFLIEGEITEFFKGHLDFSQLFEYNIEVIDKEQD